MSARIYHIHHIIPRHAGGTDDSANLIKLTIEEHAEAHRILWEQHGRLQDKMAWLMLSGKTEEGELVRIELSRSDEARQKNKDAQNKRFQSPNVQERQREILNNIRSNEQHEQKRLSGLRESAKDPEVQAKRSASLKRAFATPEQKARRSAASRKLWQDPEYRKKHINPIKSTT